MKVKTPLGIGELRRTEGDRVIVEMDHTYECEFKANECMILPDGVDLDKVYARLDCTLKDHLGNDTITSTPGRTQDRPLTVSLVLGLVLVPVCVWLAYRQRGYFAMGGEYLAGALPVMGLYVYRWFKELTR